MIATNAVTWTGYPDIYKEIVGSSAARPQTSTDGQKHEDAATTRDTHDTHDEHDTQQHNAGEQHNQARRPPEPQQAQEELFP